MGIDIYEGLIYIMSIRRHRLYRGERYLLEVLIL